MHADHIHPWSKGSQTCMDNGKMLCGGDNLAKGDRVPDQSSDEEDQD